MGDDYPIGWLCEICGKRLARTGKKAIWWAVSLGCGWHIECDPKGEMYRKKIQQISPKYSLQNT